MKLSMSLFPLLCVFRVRIRWNGCSRQLMRGRKHLCFPCDIAMLNGFSQGSHLQQNPQGIDIHQLVK